MVVVVVGGLSWVGTGDLKAAVFTGSTIGREERSHKFEKFNN
jgi:hypothetical protein